MVTEIAVAYRSTNGRRYLTKIAAIKADCRRLMAMERHYPSEGPQSTGRPGCDLPGWHWEESEECKRIYARLLRFAKFVHRKSRTQPTNNETRG